MVLALMGRKREQPATFELDIDTVNLSNLLNSGDYLLNGNVCSDIIGLSIVNPVYLNSIGTKNTVG